MKVDLDLGGFDEMRRLLAELPQASQARVVRPSMRAAARIIANRTRDATPIGPTGNLRAAAGYVKQSRDPGPYGVAYRIGYRAKLGPHALLVDKGTAQRKTRSGANRGRGPARRFFNAAVIAAGTTAMAYLKNNWALRLAVEARRFRLGQLTARGTIKPGFR